eukprot:m.108335 g.108335  ORF g.108335 m.108335 type:complete len:382 (+) comp15863_c0_seq9:341-1486(+)
MASESMVLLREQCGRLLNKDEAKSVKVALETFSQNRDLSTLVQSLVAVLDTRDKYCIFDTVGQILPVKYGEEYVNIVKQAYAHKKSFSSASLESFILQKVQEERANGKAESSRPSPRLVIDFDIDDCEVDGLDMSTLEAGFMSDARNAEDAEDYFQQACLEAGLFLVRRRDPPEAGSQVVQPYRVCTLSYVDDLLNVRHESVVQPEKGGPFFVNVVPFPKCTTLDDLLKTLRQTPQYRLTHGPHQCQLWFHGVLSEEEAASRLKHVKNDGTVSDGLFLVWQRSAAQYVLSVAVNQQIVHHKVFREDNHWFEVGSPTVFHRSLTALVQHHAQQRGGLACVLMVPCKRLTNQRLERLKAEQRPSQTEDHMAVLMRELRTESVV